MSAGLRVLVVEDQPANQMLVEAVLARAGYQVDLAADAVEAKARLQAAVPDLILMDIQLPGQDGLSLARELRSRPETAAIPIVALTAHAMAADFQQALAAGCIGFISKPIDTRALAAQVEVYLSLKP